MIHSKSKTHKHELEDNIPRFLTQEEFDKILAEHQEWLTSHSSNGRRADLSNCSFKDIQFPECIELSHANLEHSDFSDKTLVAPNLSNANLKYAVFEYCRLYDRSVERGGGEDDYIGLRRGADFEYADLERASFENAIIPTANFAKCNLRWTRFFNAELRECKFTDVHNLLSSQFQGADLSGTILPGDIKKFTALTQVAELSDACKKILTPLLFACVYVIITVASTTDISLLSYGSTSELPILGVEIPIMGLFVVAPLILISLQVYFVIYLQRMWEVAATLPAFFQDGRPLDKVMRVWFLNGFVRRHYNFLKANPPPFSTIQYFLILMITWFSVPITLVYLWYHFLVGHDVLTSLIHVGVTLFSINYGIRSFLVGKRTVRGNWKNVPWIMRWSVVTSFAGVLLLVSHLGMSSDSIFRRSANFDNVSMTKRGQEDINPSKTRSFRGRDLKYLRARNAELSGSQLDSTDLTGALLAESMLSHSSLRGCRLDRANLYRGDLSNCDMHNASFREANLQFAQLDSSIVRETDFSRADLYYASFRGAIMSDETDMTDADIQGADFREIQCMGALNSVTKAYNWPLARYDSLTLSMLNLPVDHNSRLDSYDLSGYRFDGANFTGANFALFDMHDCLFMGAKFDSSNLSPRDLTNTTFMHCSFDLANMSRSKVYGAVFESPSGLTVGQVESTRGWSFAYFPPEMVDSLELPANHNIRLSQKELSSYSFSNTLFGQVVLDSFNFSDADFQGAEIWGSDFVACGFDSAVSDSARVEGTVFSHCSLRDVSLKAAYLRNVGFIDCDLTGVSFRSAQLMDIDFTNSVVDSIDLRESIVIRIKGLDNAYTESLVKNDSTWSSGRELTILGTLPDSSIRRVALEILLFSK